MAKNKLGGKLTNVGQVQAEFTAKALRVLPITAIHSSIMTRAVETARPIRNYFDGIPLKRTGILRECVPTIPSKFADYFALRAEITPEYLSDSKEQVDTAFTRFFKPTRSKTDRHEVLVCHGNVIRYLLCRVMEVDLTAWGNMRIYHCGISRVLIDYDHAMYLISYNDVGHLPPHLWTEM
jgi:broad specificity phosphatase PhoE